MKHWDHYSSWEAAEASWDSGAKEAAERTPLKTLKVLPQMPGITEETARHLKWKSLKYMITHDAGGKIRRHFFRHPFRYGFNYLKSVLNKKSYRRDGDFFLYGVPTIEAFEHLVGKNNTLLVVGFSYCQKPHACPSGRFTDQCLRDANHPVCRQCDIGKILHALPDMNTIPLMIPTVHYIGDKIFELVHTYPKSQLLFLITACEMTLEMFGDLGNMVNVKGIGVRLDGRICNTLRAFELSEEGVKPGLTVVTPATQNRLLNLVRKLRVRANASS
jgi:hypothetical protein